MDPLISGDDGAVELLAAHAHIWEHIFSFHKSMALKCAIEVGIPDAIQKHSKPITLLELASILAIHPTKAPSLGRLMRLLVHTNFFSMKKSENGEIMFDLTISSQLLLKDHPLSQVAFIFGMLNPIMIDPAHHLSTWLNSEAESPFYVTHGRSIWEHANAISMFNDYFNQAMASDARFVARFFTSNDNKIKGFFEGIKSLVDVGGEDGTMAKAIAEAYPELKCIVLDLPHVVEGLKGNGSNLVYIGGDMFRSIPLADAVLLKWILHDWSDDNCIKILEQCKEAIPDKDHGGKVIIIDIVLDNNADKLKHSITQIVFDMQMMSVSIGGKERTEEEWKKLFVSAGFGDYKVLPILGLRSIIEVYPL